MSRSGLNTGSSPQFRKASNAGGSGSSNNFINSSSFNDRSKSRVNSTGLLWNPGTLRQDISYREGATKRKKKKRGLVYHHESGLSKKRKKRENVEVINLLEDSEDDVDVLDLVNNDNKNAEKERKIPDQPQFIQANEGMQFTNVAGHDQRNAPLGYGSYLEGRNRKRTKHPEIVDLLDDNVGNETYHDKTISKERQYAPIEIYDGYVRNTHVISKNPVLGNSVARPDMSRILSVFPNVKLEWLKLKMKEYRNTDTIISYMAENGYPEEKDSDAAIANRQTDYYVVDNLRDTSATYRRDARIKLAMKFRKVPYSTIDMYFRKYLFQYVPTLKAMSIDENKSTGSVGGCKLLQNKRYDNHSLKFSMDPQLRKEIEWLDQNDKRKLSEIDLLLKKPEYQAKQPDTECGCCFNDVIKEATISCSFGHTFCGACLSRYVQEEIFGKQRAKIQCMDMSGKCTGEFSNAMLQKALSPVYLEKYEFVIAQRVLKDAKVDDLFSCPFCDSIAILPKGNNIFSCPNPSCKIESCRMCRKRSHIPFKCDEVDGRSADEIRKKIEEKMTEAKVRTCPKCSTRFFKEEGCNKMTCTKCGTFSCYICRKEIPKKVKYKHFCQKPHCTHKKCKGCPLYSKSSEDDARAVKEAGLSAKEAALLELKNSGRDFKNATEVVNKIARELQN